MDSRNLSKKTTFSFLVVALTVLKTNFWSYVSPSHLFFQFIFENHSRFRRKEQDISERPRTSIFHLALAFAFALTRFTRKKSRRKRKRKRKEMKKFPFLASALVLAFAFAFASLVWTSLYTYFVYVNLDLKSCFLLIAVRSAYSTYHTLHSNTGVTGVKNSKLKTLSWFPCWSILCTRKKSLQELFLVNVTTTRRYMNWKYPWL